MPSTEPSTTLTLADEDLAFATDLYQLTMGAAYARERPLPAGTFELFVRRLPPRRNFLVFAGLEQALASLLRLRFSPAQLDYLKSLPPFAGVEPGFFDLLARFRFTGDVWAMREGTVFFPEEPVLQVTGTLLEAQLVETLLLSIVNFQTAVASKAARVRLAAGERVELAEFGSRRAHGPQAAAWAARAAYLAGFDATSNVLAGQRLGIPVAGTMAHSFVMSCDRVEEAFTRYLDVFPQHSVLLVDTYDSLAGVRKAVALGRPFAAIRLDSGDLAELAIAARRLLDGGGRRDARIFASGDLDEDRIAALRARGVPIDAFGVGTRIAVSADAPYIGGIYKLVEVERGGVALPRFKASPGKATLPGKKQVIRFCRSGELAGDRIVPRERAADFPAEAQLLRPVLRQGRLLAHDPLDAVRQHARRQLSLLPQRLRAREAAAEPYPVTLDPALGQARREGQGPIQEI